MENGPLMANFRTWWLCEHHSVQNECITAKRGCITKGGSSYFVNYLLPVRFQVLTVASMKFRFVFWDVPPCKIIVNGRFRGTCCLHHQGDEAVIPLMMEAARTSETSFDNYFTRQYMPQDKSELYILPFTRE
jgi:hypothetical protein